MCLFMFLFSHGPGAECRRPPRPDPLCVPGVVAWGRGLTTDHQPAGSDQPQRRGPVPRPGSLQLLLHLRPQPEETPTFLGGKTHFMVSGIVKRRRCRSQVTGDKTKGRWKALEQPWRLKNVQYLILTSWLEHRKLNTVNILSLYLHGTSSHQKLTHDS